MYERNGEITFDVNYAYIHGIMRSTGHTRECINIYKFASFREWRSFIAGRMTVAVLEITALPVTLYIQYVRDVRCPWPLHSKLNRTNNVVILLLYIGIYGYLRAWLRLYLYYAICIPKIWTHIIAYLYVPSSYNMGNERRLIKIILALDT